MAFAICDFLKYDRRDFPEESLRGYYQCPECNKWYTDNWITRHLSEAHDIDIRDLYLDAHPEESRYCKYCGKERYWEGRVYRLGKTCRDPECQRKSQSDTMIENKTSGFCGYILDSKGPMSLYKSRKRILNLMLEQGNRDTSVTHYLYLMKTNDRLKFGISLDLDGRLEVFGAKLINYVSGSLDYIANLEYNIAMKFRHYLIINDTKTNYTEFMDISHLEELNGYFEHIKLGDNEIFDESELTD